LARIILAFNGDLESRLALHWLSRERGHEVVALLINLGQEIYLEPRGELALELGAVAARIVDRSQEFLHDFALPVLQAGAVYQGGCFLGSALSRYVIARELVRVAHEQGCQTVAHSSATRGNDQLRLESALAAQDPKLEVLAPVREWNLRTLEDKLAFAHRRRILVEEPTAKQITIDRNHWGASIYLGDLLDPWEEPPPEIFTLTRPPDQAPDRPVVITLGFQAGLPCSLDGRTMDLLALVRELNRLGGEHGVGRNDVVEDGLLGIKSREFYETPAPTVLRMAHRDLESLVQSRDLLQMKEALSRRYAELVYSGQWFHDLRRALQGFVEQTQRYVTGEVRLRLFKGSCGVVGRRSPHSLYDGRLHTAARADWLDNRWAQAFAALWSMPVRLAARQQPLDAEQGGGWAAP
jgi:argininosuccinate synthase